MNESNVNSKIKWFGLIKHRNDVDGKEIKVVKCAEGVAPWGSRIKAELSEDDFGSSTILISLPEQDGRILAMLDGNRWEIWIKETNEIHIVYPIPEQNYIPDEYLMIV